MGLPFKLGFVLGTWRIWTCGVMATWILELLLLASHRYFGLPYKLDVDKFLKQRLDDVIV